jgi:type II secretory pathway pseudopilin PulG
MGEGRGRSGVRGYAMVALLVAMSVMAIALSTALPVFSTMARREREAELVFRGEQYARAIGMFQRRYGNALPPTVEVLVNERFLRKQYKDPITGEDFQLLGPGSPELAEALAALPEQVQNARGRGQGSQAAGRGAATGRGRGAAPTTRFTAVTQAARETAGGQAPGGIVAVASTSTADSLRLYNGKGKYNEWVFMALQTSTQAGAPPGVGGQTPGARGGTAAGGRGQAPTGRGQAPTGRGAQPPGGARGRGTFGRGRGL